MGKIKAINISNLDGENTFYINQAILNKNKGIVNDRYYGNFKNSYEQVTFIESEKIDDFNRKIKKKLDYKDFRRNIITKGIKLNHLVGKKLKIGSVEVEGMDLCRPCRHLNESLNQDNVLKEFLRKGGLRCQILTSSSINIGDKVEVLD